jgi:hypothetical protein
MNKWVNKYKCYWKTVTIKEKGSNVLALLCVRHNDNSLKNESIINNIYY